MCVWWVCSRFLGLSPDPPLPDRPSPGPPKIALFVLSPAENFILSSLSGGLLVELWPLFKAMAHPKWRVWVGVILRNPDGLTANLWCPIIFARSWPISTWINSIGVGTSKPAVDRVPPVRKAVGFRKPHGLCGRSAKVAVCHSNVGISEISTPKPRKQDPRCSQWRTGWSHARYPLHVRRVTRAEEVIKRAQEQRAVHAEVEEAEQRLLSLQEEAAHPPPVEVDARRVLSFVIFASLLRRRNMHAPQGMECSGGPDGWLQVILGPRPPSTKWPAKPVPQKPNSNVVHRQSVSVSASKVSPCARGGLQPRSVRSFPPRSFASRRLGNRVDTSRDCRHRGVHRTCAESRRTSKRRNRSSCRRSWPRQRKI